MKAETRRERMARLFGDDPALLEAFEKSKPPPPPTAEQKVLMKDGMLQGEAILDLVWNPKHYVEKMCKQCNNPFATNRPRHTSICSVECMKRALAEIGLEWDPLVPIEDRFVRTRHYPDMLIPHEVLEHLRILLFPTDDVPEPLSQAEEHTQAS